MTFSKPLEPHEYDREAAQRGRGLSELIHEAAQQSPELMAKAFDQVVGEEVAAHTATLRKLRVAESENERLLRGMVWAHYELAVEDEPDTLWLMDLLAGLLDGKTADEAAAVARKRAPAAGEE